MVFINKYFACIFFTKLQNLKIYEALSDRMIYAMKNTI